MYMYQDPYFFKKKRRVRRRPRDTQTLLCWGSRGRRGRACCLQRERACGGAVFPSGMRRPPIPLPCAAPLLPFVSLVRVRVARRLGWVVFCAPWCVLVKVVGSRRVRLLRLHACLAFALLSRLSSLNQCVPVDQCVPVVCVCTAKCLLGITKH